MVYRYTTLFAIPYNGKFIVGRTDKAAEKIPDNRHGPNTKHRLVDAVKSAFGVFYFQFPSFLRYIEGNAEQAEKE
ncbi:hypothetical protein FACS1894137_19080 [Spirochaetia bacterium]|nr:hypothetical protein FACS1894137_19080 [Spirochaetia bacterium]